MGCDVRLMEDKTPFIDGTRVILLLGAAAMHEWCPKDTGNNTLNEMRGSPLYVGNIPAIASFFPQDCTDIKAYEQEFNELSKEYEDDEEADDGEDGDEGDVKRLSNTKRSNYALWLKCDIEKCKKLLLSSDTLPKWVVELEPEYRIYPPADEVINVLLKHKNEYLEFDIETDYENQTILCFSFTFTNLTEKTVTIYSVPVINADYKWAYSALAFIIKALVIAIRDNILVAHNGAAFDFMVLGYKYHIPVVRTYDTMIAQHRIYPDVEKSLGHCTSMWTNQRFHKDTDSQAYFTHEHMMQKLKYCGKDVFTMWLIHKAQREFAKTIPGMQESIQCAMDSIRPYITCMIQGIRYDEKKLKEICNENDRLMQQYIRIINILIGPLGMLSCKKAVKGKAKAFPGSNTQCVDYFHDQLGYGIVTRSPKTQKPSLGKKNMFKLALKNPENPVIMFTLLYRQVAKEYGSLKFNPWKGDDGVIFPRTKVEVAE